MRDSRREGGTAKGWKEYKWLQQVTSGSTSLRRSDDKKWVNDRH